ncbi:MAG: TIGR00725 family protein [Thermoleophilia bacterium]|nr:TIGR00725 family protein [Thermoleophilia bacterium]
MKHSEQGECLRYVSVIGAGACDAETEKIAEEVGRLIARSGMALVCGGLGGVMEAACRGAKAEGGVTIGILPGLSRGEGNPWLDYSICTGIGHARNLAVASSGDAVIALGGEFGTLSEIGLALKTGRRVILMRSWEISRDGKMPPGVRIAKSPEEAVRLAAE